MQHADLWDNQRRQLCGVLQQLLRRELLLNNLTFMMTTHECTISASLL